MIGSTMYRSVARLCQQVQLHLTLRNAVLSSSGAMKVSLMAPSVSTQRSLHSTPMCAVLDKDLKGKKKTIRMAQEAKSETLEATTKPEVDIGLDGLTSSGVTIPTEATLSKTVGGIRYDELPIVHVKSSPNNTLMCLTDHTGRDILSVATCGMEGFKNVKKSTNVAAQATGFSLGYKAKRKGIKAVRVKVKGLGAGRLSSMKGLQMAGLEIISITDCTPLIHLGPRPRKAKRL